MQKHLQEQVATYGEQSLVNLVNQKGHEKPVKEAFEQYVSQVHEFLTCRCIPYLTMCFTD